MQTCFTNENIEKCQSDIILKSKPYHVHEKKNSSYE